MWQPLSECDLCVILTEGTSCPCKLFTIIHGSHLQFSGHQIPCWKNKVQGDQPFVIHLLVLSLSLSLLLLLLLLLLFVLNCFVSK